MAKGTIISKRTLLRMRQQVLRTRKQLTSETAALEAACAQWAAAHGLYCYGLSQLDAEAVATGDEE